MTAAQRPVAARKDPVKKISRKFRQPTALFQCTKTEGFPSSLPLQSCQNQSLPPFCRVASLLQSTFTE
jgi:hypothetical protein